jgi:hypothetical protein
MAILLPPARNAEAHLVTGHLLLRAQQQVSTRC